MGSPLRAVYDNAADRATVSVTGTPQLPVQNLLTNNKNETYRSAAGTLSVTVTATWFSPEIVGCIALPLTNFSATATMRVRLYSDMACTVQIADSGVVSCSQGAGGKVAGLTAQQSASAFSYGGGVSAVVWFTIPVSGVYGCKVDLVDTSNLQGCLEATRLVIGNYFSPIFNAEYGGTNSWEDTTADYRTDAGNHMVDIGTKYKKVSINLSFMQPADRAGLWKLANYCGKSQPIFLSVMCGHTDKELEESLTVYGRFTTASVFACTSYNVYQAPMEVVGI